MVFGAGVRKFLPYVNFVVASSALVFQTTVLYPWHHQLDAGFHILKDEQAGMLKGYHEVKIQRFAELERRMEGLERRMQALDRAASQSSS